MKYLKTQSLQSFLRTKLFVVISLSLLAVVLLSAVAIKTKNDRQHAVQEAVTQRLEELINETKQESVLDAENQAAKKSEQSTPTTTDETPEQNSVKYCTTPDPQCKTYSNTPPPANPQSFDIAITRNGQVSAGTVISYNATKGEKAYYGGDLVSVNSVVASKNPASPNYQPTIVISSPDGHSIRTPYKMWNDYDFSVSPVNPVALSGSKHQIQVAVMDSALPGTYVMHVASNRTSQTVDAWWYHKFITVTVIE